ncbi:hypothetical protein TWF506_008746 [Arthrobotrys conoides]|uniref:F-box domain-containing protein n=1 Tax=Arthrobotrys conoides TaxID=74498 RepID=A0AAN8PGG2_9PEZI
MATNPPSPSLNTLPPELLSNILTYLPQKHYTFPLLLTNKRLYHFTLPHFWKSLESSPQERHTYLNTTKPSKHPKFGLRRLGDDIQKLYNNNIINEGDDILGFRYLKHMILWPSDLETRWSPWGDSGLFSVVSRQIAAGRVQLRAVEFILHREVSDEAYEFINTLKQYSKTWPQRLKITIHIPWSPHLVDFVTKNFRSEDITDLRVHSDEDIAAGGSGEGLENAIDNIKRLTTLLQELPFLEVLDIEGPVGWQEYFPTVIQPLLPELSRLQNAVLGLKRVRILYISGSLFHPSFFLIPPENVRKLTITQEASWEWWRKFSHCQFSKLEELTLRPEAVWNISEWASPGDIDTMADREKDFLYRMEHLGLTTLKNLKADRWASPNSVPVDFYDLVLANNPGLDEESRKFCEVMREYTKPTVSGRKIRKR